MAQLFKNNARATLGGSGLASTVGVDGTFSVATGKGVLFPGIDPIVAGTYFDVTIQDATNIEIIRIKKRASDVFTIDSRAREGTTAVTFASGAIVALRLTAATVESVLAHPATTTGAHAASAISYAGSTNLAATNVEAALDELDAEKEAAGTASSTMSTHTAAADPHPQYALDTDLTNGLAGKQAADAALTSLAALSLVAGDVLYSTGPDALQRLPKGAAGQVLAMNTGATAPEWVAPATGITTLQAWPVGAVYTSVVSTSPATLFGGTWVAFGAGRVLVGIDATQAEFDTVEEIGGAKTHTLTTAEMPAHSHTYNDATAAGAAPAGGDPVNNANTVSNTGTTGGGGAHNNLQPYIVVYFWKRTA